MLDCLGPKQAVAPILFHVATHFTVQLRNLVAQIVWVLDISIM
jgi:hypothetical protein